VVLGAGALRILLFIDFVLMGIPAFHAVIEMEDTRTKADMVLKVTGLQWKWKYEYPDSGISFISTLSTRGEQIEGEAKGEQLPARGGQRSGAAGGQEGAHPAHLHRRDPHLVGAPVRRQARRDPRLPARNLCASRSPASIAASAPSCAARTTASCRWWCAPCPKPNTPRVDKKKAEMAAAAAGSDKTWTKDELMAARQGRLREKLRRLPPARRPGHPPAFPALAGSKIVTGPLLSPEGKLIPDSHGPRAERQDRHRDAGLQGHPVRRRPGRHHHL
jgi:cytochrome c oxidase subunit 2